MAHRKVGKIDGILESNSDVGITLGTLVGPVLCAFHLEGEKLDSRMRRKRISRRSRGREEEVGSKARRKRRKGRTKEEEEEEEEEDSNSLYMHPAPIYMWLLRLSAEAGRSARSASD